MPYAHLKADLEPRDGQSLSQRLIYPILHVVAAAVANCSPSIDQMMRVITAAEVDTERASRWIEPTRVEASLLSVSLASAAKL
jgi:hypothetical protein